MTKQDAIELLRELSNFVATPPETDEAVNMAIEALSENKRTDKRTETHACDCISRQDAIEAVASRDETNGTVKVFTGRQVNEILAGLPSKTDGDLISRKEAIETLDQDVMGGLNYRRILRLLPSAQPFTSEQIQTMQELESAQIEKAYELGKADRPTGHWIETEHSTNENGFKKWIEIRCPFCGHEPVYENIDDMEFCPKCGADMRGGDTK